MKSNFFRVIDDFMLPCPERLFYRTEFKYHTYSKPRWSGGGFLEGPTFENGSLDEIKKYTKIGKWFATKPAIVEILKWPYYLIVTPLWLFIVAPLFLLISLFERREKC